MLNVRNVHQILIEFYIQKINGVIVLIIMQILFKKYVVIIVVKHVFQIYNAMFVQKQKYIFDNKILIVQTEHANVWTIIMIQDNRNAKIVTIHAINVLDQQNAHNVHKNLNYIIGKQIQIQFRKYVYAQLIITIMNKIEKFALNVIINVKHAILIVSQDACNVKIL